MEIPNEIAAKLDTVGKLYHYVLENYNIAQNKTQKQVYESEVWERVKKVIVYQLGIKPEQVKEEANFVYDFNID